MKSIIKQNYFKKIVVMIISIFFLYSSGILDTFGVFRRTDSITDPNTPTSSSPGIFQYGYGYGEKFGSWGWGYGYGYGYGIGGFDVSGYFGLNEPHVEISSPFSGFAFKYDVFSFEDVLLTGTLFSGNQAKFKIDSGLYSLHSIMSGSGIPYLRNINGFNQNDGKYVLYVSGYDVEGNLMTAETTYIIDNLPPSVQITGSNLLSGYSSGRSSGDNISVILSGGTSLMKIAKWNFVNQAADCNTGVNTAGWNSFTGFSLTGSSTYSLNLTGNHDYTQPTGAGYFCVVAEDNVGNLNNNYVGLKIDTTAPLLGNFQLQLNGNILTQTGYVMSGSAVKLTFTGSESISQISIYYAMGMSGSRTFSGIAYFTSTNSDKSWEFNYIHDNTWPTSGPLNYEMKAVDRAGNIGLIVSHSTGLPQLMFTGSGGGGTSCIGTPPSSAAYILGPTTTFSTPTGWSYVTSAPQACQYTCAGGFTWDGTACISGGGTSSQGTYTMATGVNNITGTISGIHAGSMFYFGIHPQANTSSVIDWSKAYWSGTQISVATGVTTFDYAFRNIPDGTYVIEFPKEHFQGMATTTGTVNSYIYDCPTGFTDNIHSCASPDLVVASGSVTNLTRNISLTENTSLLTGYIYNTSMSPIQNYNLNLTTYYTGTDIDCSIPENKASISCNRIWRNAQTNSNGLFQIKGISSGKYVIELYPNTYMGESCPFTTTSSTQGWQACVSTPITIASGSITSSMVGTYYNISPSTFWIKIPKLQKYNYGGSVYIKDSSNKAGNVQINLSSDKNWYSATTDASGNFLFSGINEGNYKLSTYNNLGYPDVFKPLNLSSSVINDIIRLGILPNARSLSGAITIPVQCSGGNTYGNFAWINLSKRVNDWTKYQWNPNDNKWMNIDLGTAGNQSTEQGTYSCTTISNSIVCNYKFDAMLDGTYEYQVNKEGCLPAKGEIVINGTNALKNIILSSGISISGTLKNSSGVIQPNIGIDVSTVIPDKCNQTTAYLDQECVQAWNDSFWGYGFSDANGNFVLKGLKENKKYNIKINDNLGRKLVSFTGSAGSIIGSDGTIYPTSSLENTTMIIGSGIRMRGNITQTDGVSPVSWGRVVLIDSKGTYLKSGPSGEAGEYNILGVGAGTYNFQVFAQNGNYIMLTGALTVPQNPLNNQFIKNFKLQKLTSAASSGTGSIQIDSTTVTTSKDIAAPGDQITFKVRLKNIGTTSMTKILSLSLPSSTYVTGATLSLITSGVSTSFTNGTNVTLAAGQEKQVNYTFTLNPNITSNEGFVKFGAQYGSTQIGNAISSIAFATVEGPAAVQQGQNFKIYGTATSDATVKIYDNGIEIGTAQANGKWWTKDNVSLSTTGTHEITVSSYRNGVTTRSTKSLSVNVGASIPTVKLVSISAGWNGTITSSGSQTGVPAFTIFEGTQMDFVVDFTGASIDSAYIKSDFISNTNLTLSNSNKRASGSVAAGWNGYGEKKITLVYTKGSTTYEQPIAEVLILIDPSGYIYDTEDSTRIQGVTSTVWQLVNSNGNAVTSIVGADLNSDGSISDAEEISGAINSLSGYSSYHWERWNATPSGQINPQSTDENGKYGWMVPQGWYKVVFEGNGYSQVTSRAVYVPPAEENLNLDFGPFDISQPVVSAITPSAGSNSVPVNLSNINVVFSDRMSSSTINTTNIKLYETGANWAAVSTTVVYNSANKKAILTPSSSLTPGKKYWVNLTNSVKDDAGNSLTGTLSYYFTTASSLDTTGAVITISPNGGTFTGTTSTIAISTDESATIYYTTDGTTVTTGSNIYTTGFSLTNSSESDVTKILKVLVIDMAGNQSTSQKTFVIKSTDTTPANVVALQDDMNKSLVNLVAYKSNLNSNPSNRDSSAKIYYEYASGSLDDVTTPTVSSTNIVGSGAVNIPTTPSIYYMKTLSVDRFGNQQRQSFSFYVPQLFTSTQGRGELPISFTGGINFAINTGVLQGIPSNKEFGKIVSGSGSLNGEIARFVFTGIDLSVFSGVYYSQNGRTWTNIPVCTQTPSMGDSALDSNGEQTECYILTGTTLKIYTTHFTLFTMLVSSISSGGGNGGGSGGSGGGSNAGNSLVAGVVTTTKKLSTYIGDVKQSVTLKAGKSLDEVLTIKRNGQTISLKDVLNQSSKKLSNVAENFVSFAVGDIIETSSKGSIQFALDGYTKFDITPGSALKLLESNSDSLTYENLKGKIQYKFQKRNSGKFKYQVKGKVSYATLLGTTIEVDSDSQKDVYSVIEGKISIHNNKTDTDVQISTGEKYIAYVSGGGELIGTDGKPKSGDASISTVVKPGFVNVGGKLVEQEAFDAAKMLNLKGVTKLSAENTKYYDNLSRWESALLLSRYAQKLYGKSNIKDSCDFLDIGSFDDLTKEEILSSCKLGLYKGSNNNFYPNSLSTRGDIIIVFARLITGDPLKELEDSYDYLLEKGIIKTDDRKDSSRTINRYELYIMLSRTLEKLGK